MHKPIFPLYMFVKMRYTFYLFESTYPELLFLNVGLDPVRYYSIKHELSKPEYDQKVRHMEALPDLFVEGRDACKLAQSILSQLELPEEEAEEVFTENSMFEVNEFYSIFNNLIDKLWQIKIQMSPMNFSR